MRDGQLLLDGEWEFLHVVEDYRTKPVVWRRIQVPNPWQAQFDDLRMRAGTGLYRRKIEVPLGWKRDRVYLSFGAVFHITRAWINGVPVGTHVGGFLPFAFDVTDAIVEGLNEIKVRVDAPSDDPADFPDTPFAEMPFGKQSWYGPLSGIWQSVMLERRIADHIARLRLHPDLASGRLAMEFFFADGLQKVTELSVTVFDPDGARIATKRIALSPGETSVKLGLDIKDVMPWSPETPDLYRVRADLIRGDMMVDFTEETCGFRTIETRDGRFYLNGKLLYLRGALDQDYYPDGICSVPSTAFLEDQFRKAKELGLNCLRCHIKAPDPRYYAVADRIGLLIWTELPNMGVSNERSRVRKRETLKGIVDRDYNHPSIICWTIINENWGVDLVHDAEHRAWLRATYDWLKTYDPLRLVVDNSPLAPSFHIKTDIADYHYYAAIPDNRGDWDWFVNELASRAAFLFGPSSETEQTGQEPLICSEFGNWGLPDPEVLKDSEGREPWWFETGHDWGEGVMYAHGIQNRFNDWSLSRVFGTLKAFARAAQWQQFRALKYEIELMRSKPTIAGYVITEFTDAHWESNGLLDMRRNPRCFHKVFATINSDTVIVPKWTRTTFWSGEVADIPVLIAHGGPDPIENASLEVTLPSGHIQKIAHIAPGEVYDAGVLKMPIPHERTEHLHRVLFELRGENRQLIASNALDLAIHDGRPDPGTLGVQIWTPEADIAESLSELGYDVAAEQRADALWVLRTFDDAVTEHVRAGGRLLLLPESDTSLTPFFPHWQAVRVISREGTLWRGDWVSTFSWLLRGTAFADLPGGPLLDNTFDRVLPRHLILNCNLLDFQARVHGAMVIGWIHKPAAFVVERGYGRGRLVISTFRLFRDPPGTDPTATVLLHRLLTLALAHGSAARREREALVGEAFG
jgi:hypothetical protein